MGPDLGNLNATSAGGYTNANLGAVQNAVKSIGPFATTYQTPTVNAPQVLRNGGVASGASPSLMDQFFGKVDSVFKESGHMIEDAGSWIARQGIEMAKGTVDLVPSMYHFGMDTYHTWEYGQQVNEITNRIQTLGKQYSSGQISLKQFATENAQIQKDNLALSQKMNGLTTKIASDGGQVEKNDMAFISGVLTVAGAGAGGAVADIGKAGSQDAALWLVSNTTSKVFDPVANTLARFALNRAEFTSLGAATQKALQASVTDTFLKAGETATAQQIARTTAVNLFMKYPIAFNYINGTGNELYHEMQTGKYGDAAKTFGYNAALLLSGGPVGEAMKYGGSALKGVSNRIFGSTSFLDELSKTIGNGNPNGLFNAIKDNPDAVRAFQSLEATNMATTDNRAVSAAYRVVNGLKANGWDLSTSTHEDFVKNVMGWHQAQTILHDALVKGGASAADARRYVVGRWTVHDANRVAAALTKDDLGRTITRATEPVQTSEVDMSKAPDFLQPTGEGVPGEGQTAPGASSLDTEHTDNVNRLTQQRLQAWEDFKTANSNSAVAHNGNLDRQIKQIITSTPDTSELYSKVSGIKAQFAAKVEGLPSSAAKQMAKLGYVPITPGKLDAPFIQGDQKLVTKFSSGIARSGKTIPESAGSSDFFTKAVKPLPILGEVGGLLTHMGLAPEKAQESVQDIFKSHLATNLGKSSIVEGLAAKDAEAHADTLVKQLTNYVNEVNSAAKGRFRLPITDLRQMTKGEIADALGIDAKRAGEVQGAIMDSMLQVPLTVRGLGDRMMDYAFKASFIPSQYMRAQGAFRFAWNPFFKMKLAAKTEILSQMESGGKWPSLPGVNKMIDTFMPNEATRVKAVSGMLEERGYFTGGFSNEAANEADTVQGMHATKSSLLTSQKRSIAGLVTSMANRTGMSAQDFVDTYPNEVRDVTEMILHYNPKSSFLNSPMARTLNFASFPFRFNLKVSTLMARTLARQDALTQMGVIHGIMQAHTFLNSQEGMQWYSQNSDAIGLLGYFSPLETLSTVSKLGGIGHESVGSLGELGGLPLGFIPQILQAEGLWHESGSYLNPKTGQPGTDYIPLTAKAKLATAISSFLGSLFTYPGSTAGLPSKSGLLAKASEGLTGSSAADWNKVPQTGLTAQQLQYQQAVQSLHASTQTQATPLTSETPMPNATTPPTKNATASSYYKSTGSSTPPARKLKKTQEPLTPLPGQSAVGQIL